MHDVAPVPFKHSLGLRLHVSPAGVPARPRRGLRPARRARPTRSSRSRTTASILRRGKDDASARARRRSSPAKPIDGGPARGARWLSPLVLADGRSPSPAAGRSFAASHRRCAQAGSATTSTRSISATLGLDESVLPVQGPPGTGKTFRGARMIVAALKAGLRVGVTAFSHAAIQNLLDDDRGARRTRSGSSSQAMYKGDGYDSRYGLVDSCDEQQRSDRRATRARRRHRVAVRASGAPRDASTFCSSTRPASSRSPTQSPSAPAAESIVLLGDPQQLPQVTKADHPERLRRLGPRAPARRRCDDPCQAAACCLTESWRMHPDVCAFVSERSYDGTPTLSRRLRPPPHRRARVTLAAPVCASRFVDHDGRSQASARGSGGDRRALPDTAHRRTRHRRRGRSARANRQTTSSSSRPTTSRAACICERVPTGVRVGTVDKFQGQEAPVVFFAMTCSSGEDVPRGVDFLFDRNRFNVAVSRAQCFAVVVVNPRLLDADCRTLQAMRARRRGVPIRGDGCSSSCARSRPAQRPLTAAYVSITRLEAGCSPNCLTICRASPSSNGTTARRSVALHARGFANVFGRSATMGASSMPSPRGARASKTRSTPIGNSRSPNRIGSGRSLAGRLTVATPMTRPRSRVGFRKHPRVAYRRSRSPRASRSASRRR